MKNFILNNASWVKAWFLESYPLSFEFIERHEDHIDWNLLSRNERIEYSIEFCEKYQERLNWKEFNPLLGQQFKGEGRDGRLIAFLDRFKDQLNWTIVSQNLRVPEDADRLISRFEDYWDWKFLCMWWNIPWDQELLRKFKSRIDWDMLSSNLRVPWRYEWIEEFEEMINWRYFPRFSSYAWDGRSLQRFREKMEKAGILQNASSFQNLLFGEGIKPPGHREWNDPLDENVDDDPVKSAECELNDDIASMDRVCDMVWDQVEQEEEVTQFDLLQLSFQAFSYLMSQNSVDRLELASNGVISEPYESLKEFGHLLNWGCYRTEKLYIKPEESVEFRAPGGLSANGFILWTEKMLDEFQDRIHWDLLGKYGRIKWTEGIIEKHFHRFNKEDLLKNHALFHKLILPEMNENMRELVFGMGMG